MDFVTGGVAAMSASLFSNPFDVLKTRMQLQGELCAKGEHAIFYRNTLHAGYVVAKNEGIRGLQKGLGAALLMHGVRNTMRLGTYETFVKHGYVTNAEGKTVAYKSALASAVSGAIGAFMGSPFFMIKTQLQAQAAASIAVGHQHSHRGVAHAFRDIYKRHGILGLWRGVNGTVLRAVVGSSAQLTTYSVTKEFFENYEIFPQSSVLNFLASSIIGGVAQTIAMQPFDLISIRLYNQKTDAFGRGTLYNGIIDCFFKIKRAEGLRGFYKGVGANYMRLAPHSAFTLVFWDELKSLQAKYIDGAPSKPYS